jgi:DNA-binding LacI/PurR family transcriptional regulator
LSHAEQGESHDREHPQGDPTRSVTISYMAGRPEGSISRSGEPDTHAGIDALIHLYRYHTSNPVHRGNTMELVINGLEHMWGVEIIRGVQRVAREHRAGVVVTEFGPERSTIRYWIDDTLARRPGFLIAVAQLSEQQRNRLRARGIPFVVFDPFTELPDDVRFVGATNWRGGRSATRHLIGLGHDRIAMVTGPDHAFCRARLDGYRSALESAGLPVRAHLIVSAGLTREDGCTAALGLLHHPEPPTAIFASNDLQALGVYQAAQMVGLRIPADLSVVGFDDLPIATLVHPALTTIRQPLTAMATAAAELTLALARGDESPHMSLELATTLTVRKSTAAPYGSQ